MRSFIKFFLAVVIASFIVACSEPQRSSANFVEASSFDMSDYSIETYCQDGFMFAPSLSWDNVCYFCSSSEDMNKDFRGGFILSTHKGTEDTPEERSFVISADQQGGLMASVGYLVFRQTASMPDRSITFDLSSFFSASIYSYGCYVCNTLYNKRLEDAGLLSDGDYLKVTAEFYKGSSLVGTKEKYLIKYTSGEDSVMENEWVAWNMGSEKTGDTSSAVLSNFDSIQFKVETSGSKIDPSFCLDSFCVQLDVVY